MKDMTWLTKSKLAHRGLHTKDLSVAENSMAAFKRGMEAGYGLELDLNMLKDETIVVFHDNNLKRLTGIDRHISTFDYPEIKTLKLLNTNESIPTLDDLLSLVKGQVPLLIELKPFGHIERFCEIVYEKLKHYQGKFAIFSFHPGVVKWFKKHAPDIIRGQISTNFKGSKDTKPILGFLLTRLFFNRFTKPDFISYNVEHMPNKYIDKAKKRGLTIISYVARNQKTYDFVKQNYDNIVFEFFDPK